MPNCDFERNIDFDSLFNRYVANEDEVVMKVVSFDEQ